MTSMEIVVVGTNHTAAPVELRERLAFAREQVPDALMALRMEHGLSEAAILSTCNRVEIYAQSSSSESALQALSGFLGRHGKLDSERLAPHLYRLSEPDSVRHLFRVAGGLDSMVLGETEILHQVKQAYELAHAAGATGKALNVLFQKALNAGKAVREQTALGRGCLSVGSVSIELAQKIFGNLHSHAVLLVGAGKIGEATLKRLAERGVLRLRVLNRSTQRAEALAVHYGAEAGGLGDLTQALEEADIVLTSTASPQTILTRAQVSAIMPTRRHRPLCLIDLGVPRNIDPAAGNLENVYLFNIDDLQGLVNGTQEQRQRAAADGARILEDKAHRFLTWWHGERGASCVHASSSALAAAP